MANHVDGLPKDEQFPLLKEAEGPGDTNVTCPRRKWKQRCPEVVSTCWMTLVLLGICFICLYTISLAVTKRQTVLVQYLRQRDTQSPPIFKPNSEVFYIQIIHGHVPILTQEMYFKEMALTYPLLQFNIIYLIDDSIKSSLRWPPRHSIFPIPPYKISDKTKKAIHDIEHKLQNINVTIMPVSKYLANSPLKYSWKSLPISQLAFYARVYTVWQQGGISMDFNSFNNMRNEEAHKYKHVIEKYNSGIDKKTELSILDRFHILGYITSIFDQVTNGLTYNINTTSNGSVEHKLLSRMHRSKREANIHEFVSPNETNSNTMVENIKMKNFTDISSIRVNSNETEEVKKGNNTKVQINVENESFESNNNNNHSKHEIPQLFVYEFSIIDDIIGPTYSFPESQDCKLKYGNGDMSKQVIIDNDGKFIAAYLPLNPFLGHFLSIAGNRFTKQSIQEVIMTYCFLISNNCDNIVLI